MFAMVAVFSMSSTSNVASVSGAIKDPPQKRIYIMWCHDCDYMWSTPCGVFEWHCPVCNSTNVSVPSSTICFY